MIKWTKLASEAFQRDKNVLPKRNCQIYGRIEVIKEEHSMILKIMILVILPAR